MNEDDTFRILKRPTIEELNILFDKEFPHYIPNKDADVERFCQKHGWTLEEVKKAVRR